jgi:predicted metal-dependent hydrolase
MTTKTLQIIVEGIPVEVVRKRIKNLHLAVYPPDGRVRLAVPLHLDESAARMAVATRLSWVQRKQAIIREQARETEREYVSGESHYVSGQRYLLDVIESDAPPCVSIASNKKLRLTVLPGTDRAGRKAVLDHWYMSRLRDRLRGLVEQWSKKVGVAAPDWRIKPMRTKWGSYSKTTRRVSINPELAKKSERCLEYILVHELIHILEPRHNDRFKSLMTRFLPSWKSRKDELNQNPLAYEDWTY